MDVYSARDLGAAARQRREALGLTQQSAAELAGVTRDWLLNFEAGKPGVSLSRVFTVLNALQLRLEVGNEPREHNDPHNDGPDLDDVFARLHP